MLEKIIEKFVKNPKLTRRKFLNLGLAALLTISGRAYNPVKAAGDNTTQTVQTTQTIQPYAPIEEGSNIYVYQSLKPEELAEYLHNEGTRHGIKLSEKYWDADFGEIEFGQTKEQLEKTIQIAYELAAKNIDEDNWGMGYPLNKEQLEKTVEKTGAFPIMLQEYVGNPKKEDEKIYLTPIENLPGKRNVAQISTAIITGPNTKLEEDPYCDYEILLESTIDPKTGEIKETQILPKEKKTYNTPYNKEGIEELEEWGYDTLFGSGTERIYYGDGHEYPPETKAYIVGCIIKRGDIHNIYFSPPTIWRVHPGKN